MSSTHCDYWNGDGVCGPGLDGRGDAVQVFVCRIDIIYAHARTHARTHTHTLATNFFLIIVGAGVGPGDAGLPARAAPAPLRRVELVER